MNRKEEKEKPDVSSSLWNVYKVSLASLERLFMFKYSSEEKQEQNLELSEPWKNQQKMSRASLTQETNQFPHS